VGVTSPWSFDLEYADNVLIVDILYVIIHLSVDGDQEIVGDQAMKSTPLNFYENICMKVKEVMCRLLEDSEALVWLTLSVWVIAGVVLVVTRFEREIAQAGFGRLLNSTS
jgi:hypothetical protein